MMKKISGDLSGSLRMSTLIWVTRGLVQVVMAHWPMLARWLLAGDGGDVAPDCLHELYANVIALRRRERAVSVKKAVNVVTYRWPSLDPKSRRALSARLRPRIWPHSVAD